MSAEPDPPSSTGQSVEVAGSAVVAALEDAWTAIRGHHPDVPQVVIILGAGSESRRGLFKWGHFAAARWHVAGANRPEVLVSGEGLRRGAHQVLATLMHEAAHGIANTRQIRDTSRQGRWHNRRFATLAGELGLKVTQDKGTGWSQTHLTEQLATRYHEQLTGLSSALQLWRHAELQLGTPTGSRNLLACSCECGRKLRVAKSTLEQAPIICGACDEPFTPERDLTLNRQPTGPADPEDPDQRSIAAEATVGGSRDLTRYCAANCDLNHAAVPHPPWDCNAPQGAPTFGEADRRVLAELDQARLPWVRYATPLLLSAGEIERLRSPILSATYALEVDEHGQGVAEAERLSQRLEGIGDRLTNAELDAKRASTVTDVPTRLSCADANLLRQAMSEAANQLDDYARRRAATDPPYLLGTEHFTTTASTLRDWCAATLARQQQRTTATSDPAVAVSLELNQADRDRLRERAARRRHHLEEAAPRWTSLREQGHER
jgi:hypothetical protein